MMKKLSNACLISMAIAAQAQTPKPSNGIQSVSNYQARYGESHQALEVDASKELPRYPALEPAAALKSWKIKKGFKLSFVAHEPQVRDPIAVCFDEKGRMFVCEMIDYSEQRDVTPHLGRVSMLEDKDGDGYYETSTVFADNVAWPTGIIWANGQLFVIATPDIWSFKDEDGDGKAEKRDVVYTGFGTGLEVLNVQGMANSPQWGQDNKIHILSGGGNRGKIHCPSRPDLPPLELSGQDFWFDPLTLDFGLQPGGAQYGMSFDDYGRRFACANSDHLQYWIHDGRYTTRNPHYRLPNPRQSIAVDGPAAEVFRISPDEPWRILRTRWRVSGVVKGAVEGGGRVSGYFTGASGTTVYRGDALGPDFLNHTLTGDAGGQLAHRKKITYAADGINLAGQRPSDEAKVEFAASKDTWVRVVNFANAPDGCFYICDMYREVIEHPWSIPEQIKQHIDLNQGNNRGRLYRIQPDRADFKPRTKVNLAGSTTAGLVGYLKHANGWHRDTAHRLLIERKDSTAIPALKALILDSQGSVASKLHALGVLRGLNGLDDATLLSALSSKHPLVVERAVELAPSHLLIHDEVWSNLQLNERLNFTSTLAAGDIDPKNSEAKAKVVQRFVAALKTDKDWLHAAVYSAPPIYAADVVLEALQNEVHPEKLNPLLLSIGAENQQDQLVKVIASMVKQPMGSQAVMVAALAEGLAQSKSNLSQADPQGLFQAAFASAEKTAISSEASQKDRAEAVALLGLSPDPKAQDMLLQLLLSNHPLEVSSAALQTFTKFHSGKIASHVLPLWPQLHQETAKQLLEVLVNRPQLTKAFLESLGKDQSPQASDLNASQVQTLIAFKNPKLGELAREKLASVIPPSRASVIKKYQASTQLEGDKERGKQQYMMRCMACHVADGQGMAVGPDMVTVKSRGRDGILEAIVDPHKEVAPQYIAYQFLTKDGRAFHGIITQDDAQAVSLKMMGGISQTLGRTEIKSSSSAGQSLMPEGLESGMSEQDMADLLTYIESL